MILHLDPGTPIVIRGATATVLALHIGGASLGILSGAVALVAPKGRRLHRAAGNVFFVSMLTMSAIAAVVAPMLPDRISAMMGVFTFYLTATAWAAVRRPQGQIGGFETAAMFLGLAAAAGFASLAWIGASHPRGLLDGEPSQIGYVFAAVAGLAVAGDLGVIRRGGLSGAPRIARHLWRMCVALFIAAGSAAAQPKVVALLPQSVRGSPMLIAPALAVLVLMVFWLVRTRFSGRAQVASNRLATT